MFGTFSLLVGGAFGLLDILVNDKDGYVMSDVHEVRSVSSNYYLAFLPDKTKGFELEHKWMVEPKGGKDLLVGWLWFQDIDNVTTNRSFETPKNWYRSYKVISQDLEFIGSTVYNPGLTGVPMTGKEPFRLWSKEVKSGDIDRIELHLDWEPNNVMKALVFMNTDVSQGVSVDLNYETRMPLLLKLPMPLLAFGLVLIVLGSLVLVLFKKGK